MNSLVSIIIPSFNRAKIINETLDSLLEQTYSNWQCIIVDDGSTDNTANVIDSYCKKDNRFVYFERLKTAPKGASSCRNIGITKSKGEYILFLDSDDLLASFCLEERVKTFGKNPNCDFITFKMKRFNKKPNLIEKSNLKPLETKAYLSSFLQLNSVWQITSPIYKQKFLNKISGFNVALKNYEDIEIAIKSVYNSRRFLSFDNVDSFYRNDVNYREKYKSKEIKIKSVNSFIVFMISVHEKVINVCSDKTLKKTYKSDIVEAYKKVFLINIKDHFGQFKTQNKKILNFLNTNNYLTKRQNRIFNFVQNIVFRIHKIKGIGVYRLIKYLYQLK